MNNEPLISLCIITYNSSKTLVETLESAKAQTYKNIELIVSDDCSTDDTIDIARKWLVTNDSYFKHTAIITTPHNMGVAGNDNNAIRHAQGEWVKCIAGDDILLPTCIADNVSYIIEKPQTNILASLPQTFKIVDGTVVKEKDSREDDWIKWNSLTVSDKLRLFVDHCALSSPTLFIRKSFAISHPFDEQIPFLEDWTYMFNLLFEGIDIPLMPKHTVLYRINDGSLIHQKNCFFSERMDMSERIFWYKYRIWGLQNVDSDLYDKNMKLFLIHDIQDGLFNNKPNFIKKVLNKIIVWMVCHICTFELKRTMITVNTRRH